mmetsp:Transcript_5482/g.15941  ORF Transcript_5482/g.15941 Transcript_5482/m.15941 type:complete len:393 (-) Transcript_5482:127-1305(-)
MSVKENNDAMSAIGNARRFVRNHPSIAIVLGTSAVIALLSLAGDPGSRYLLAPSTNSRMGSRGAAPGSLDKPRMCEDSGRCSPLDTSKTFAFTYISKSAGWSLNKALQGLIPWGNYNSKSEPSVHWHMRKYPADYNIISLKSPRHHVWSLFAQCKYGEWPGPDVTGPNFPRSGATPESDDVDFNSWLDHFVPLGEDGFFNCYHPANYQSRALTTLHSNPHGVIAMIFEPSLDEAISTYRSQNFVLITEFYHESMCLFHHRLALGPTGLQGVRSVDEATDFYETKCRCPKPQVEHTFKTHHKEGHRSSLRDTLPLKSLGKIEALTKVDVELYKSGLDQFMSEVAWLESDLGLGRRVLCDESLQQAEGELWYLGLSVTQLYHDKVADLGKSTTY